ncbi:hypothetical protein ZIOFF_058442 [Zingiber officinale]|uniref:Uncharacterized protein n=1 Tax=Zingiber officinale TaxID=94328 RepID=A0A8J5FB49_ZINOF|nr:hypothetical protein ZIOFF_058442 [Zingiber officinale]
MLPTHTQLSFRFIAIPLLFQVSHCRQCFSSSPSCANCSRVLSLHLGSKGLKQLLLLKQRKLQKVVSIAEVLSDATSRVEMEVKMLTLAKNDEQREELAPLRRWQATGNAVNAYAALLRFIVISLLFLILRKLVIICSSFEIEAANTGGTIQIWKLIAFLPR